MTPSEQMRHAAEIADFAAAEMPVLRETGIPAALKFTAKQLRQAADAADGLQGAGIESIFADELEVSGALIGVTA